MKRSKTPSFVLIILILMVAAVGLQIVLAAPDPKPAPPPPAKSTAVAAEGRVVGRAGFDSTVGTDVAGTIEHVAVVVNQPVRKGEVIARLRADDLRAVVAEAEARLAEAESDTRLFASEVARAEELWKAQVGTRQAYERALRDSESARARRATAAASLIHVRATLGKREILAPIDGIVVERAVDPGESVDAGDPIATIVDARRIRVDAEVDEFDAGRIEPGAPVRVRADGYDGEWRGRVEEVPLRVVGRSIRPNDPAQPVDTRVLIVGVELLEPTPLKIGQRVDVSIGR
ncbi:MAG TPA: efflux RND transporter periplasmic adaptor subunit [Thermoanaerobaculia bacterium]|nr:efflux RND transporter periplasmic adaptor subunit [Thermoanaerobaculia bacterium]